MIHDSSITSVETCGDVNRHKSLPGGYFGQLAVTQVGFMSSFVIQQLPLYL